MTETSSVIVERQLAAPAEKVWRALTDPALMADWLMASDFQPVADRPFTFRADWGSVDCRVTAVEPNRSLAYTWSAYGLESLVVWTLTPSGSGTHLRMEQSGFTAEQKREYAGAVSGWAGFIDALETVVAREA